MSVRMSHSIVESLPLDHVVNVRPLFPTIPFLEPDVGDLRPMIRTSMSWFHENWNVPFAATVIYIVVIFGLKFVVLPGTERFRLKGSLAAWNLSLALFSTIGALRTVPLYFICLNNWGYEVMVCSHPSSDVHPYTATIAGYWVLLFIWSKIPEMIDTLFIVLRQGRLIFLHWYHHISVLLFCWLAWAENSPSGPAFCAMNFTVHAFMYSYYFLSTIGMNPIPGIFVTLLQIIQMAFGVVIVLSSAYYYFHPGHGCAITPFALASGFVLYGSYLVLFVSFYLERWVRPRAMKALSTQKETKKE